MDEVWCDVIEFPNLFSVSNKGRVYSKRSNKILIQGTSKAGYKVISTKIGGRNGKCILRRVHRWVGEAFIDNKENKPFINHKDGNKTNNDVSNLEWCTSKENAIHAIETGLIVSQKGEKSGKSVLLDADVLEIRKLWKDKNYSQRKLAAMFNVSRSAIDHITSNRRWKHLL